MKHDNLNRIRGILSARQGAQVPKFTPGGQFLYKQLKNGKFVYSNDNGASWFKDAQFTQQYNGIQNTKFWQTESQYFDPEDLNNEANASLDYVSYAQEMQNKLAKKDKVTTTIPGATTVEGNPTASVEAAVNERAAVENERNSNRAAKQARKEELLEQGIVWQKANIDQDTQLTGNQQNRIDRISKNNPERAVRVQQRLVDRNTLTNDEVEQAVSTGVDISGKAIQGLGKAFGASQAASDSNLTKGVDSGVDAVGGMLSQMGGVAGGIGQILQIGSAAGQIIEGITGGTDQMTGFDKFTGTGIGQVLTLGINDLFGKNSDAFGIDQSMAETVGSSYGGSMDQLNEAARTADKKYGLFSSEARKKANEAIGKAKTTQNLMSNVANTAMDQRLAVQSMGEQAGLAYSMMIDGGYNQKYTYAAKHGGLLEWNPVIELEWEPQVELNWELPTFKAGGSVEFVEELEWIPEFKDGGKTEESDVPEIEETTQKNVIPEGALHKNKHHMEHAEGLTKKGIPVVDEEGEQQAEIEHSEIIFTLEVTKKLEEYYEIFYSEESTNKEKEQAALDAGKLLVYQILENTEDRTGLIESCKKGGSLTLKKSTDDLIEEVIEWMPTIVIVETEELEEKKEDKPNKKQVNDSKEELKQMIKEVLVEMLIK